MRRHSAIVTIFAATIGLAACDKPASEAAHDNATVDQTGPAGPTMVPPAGGTEYNNGAGNSNTGAWNDGSAGTKPGGTNNETVPTKK